MQTLTQDMRFCPTWAEAHERTLASLNGGRPPYPVKWKGCIVLKRGTKVDVIDHCDQSTEIVVKGKHWFADALAKHGMAPRMEDAYQKELADLPPKAA